MNKKLIKNLNNRKEEVTEIVYEIFKDFFPERDRDFIEKQVIKIDLSLSLAIENEGKLVAIYVLSPTKHEFFNEGLKGIRGEALGVLPEFRGFNTFEKFLEEIKKMDFDYLWGTQDKRLNNLNFWLKYRFLIEEDEKRYYTGQFLR